MVHPTMQQPWSQKIGGSGSKVFSTIVHVWSADYLEAWVGVILIAVQ